VPAWIEADLHGDAGPDALSLEGTRIGNMMFGGSRVAVALDRELAEVACATNTPQPSDNAEDCAVAYGAIRFS
jgi:hypothetical protein